MEPYAFCSFCRRRLVPAASLFFYCVSPDNVHLCLKPEAPTLDASSAPEERDAPQGKKRKGAPTAVFCRACGAHWRVGCVCRGR